MVPSRQVLPKLTGLRLSFVNQREGKREREALVPSRSRVFFSFSAVGLWVMKENPVAVTKGDRLVDRRDCEHISVWTFLCKSESE